MVLLYNQCYGVIKRKGDRLPFRLIFWLVIMLSGLLHVGCTDRTDEFTIPFAPVNYTIDLQGYDHELNNPLSYKIFTGKDRRLDTDRFGFAGLLVVADATGNTLFAYDLCCPYEDNKEIIVIPVNDGRAHCPSCGSIFITHYGQGSVATGPASQPLQRYRVTLLYQGVFRIGHL